MKKIFCFLVCMMINLSVDAQWFPYIRVPDKQKQMELQDLTIDVQIMGNIATTTYDMVFFNPNNKILEGEMIFPMTQNQTVVAMALDINGKMRGASAVDKDEARRIFEKQVRRNIDPALIEKVSGNQYKMRIYPFNPKGTRRIQITTEESLIVKNNEMSLSIPLTYNKKINHFGVKVNVVQDGSEMPKVKTDLENFTFTQKNQHLTASFEKQDYLLNNSLEFTFPAPKTEIVYTGGEAGKNYFYSNINVKKSQKRKVLPKKIAVVWDISFSGETRDLKKEKEVLIGYLKKIKNVDVDLIAFNIKQNKKSSFKIQQGNTTALLRAINALVYDGGTRLDKVDLSAIQADEILLFTDGVATIGDSVIKPIKTPVYVITSSDKSEFSMLSNMANKTLARLINLTTTSVEEALKQLTHKPLRLIGYKTTSAKEIYPLPSAVVGEDFTFTGLYDGKSAEIELQFGYDTQNITEQKTIKVGANQKNTLVPRQWASHKARELELDAKNNRAAIVQLGKDFSILTEYTSLLVLDSLNDYLTYKVAPKDADLLEQYNRHVSFKKQKSKYAELKEKRRALVDTLRMVNQVKKWWEKDFMPEPPEAPDEPWGFAKNPEDLDKQYGVIVDQEERMYGISPTGTGIHDMAGNIIGRVVSDKDEILLDAQESEKPQKEAKIKLKEWSPNTPYIKELRKVKNADLYHTYLTLRGKYRDMPAFYFDVADEFAKRKMSDKANLILTNLLEMKTDNVELLRVAAQKLQSYGQYQMAEILFKKIIEMYSEEPQGYRDLAKLYEASNQNQKALEQYLFILTKKWSDFNEIKKEVFVDMNGLIARDKSLNTRDINSNLIFNMPLDLRITLGWSARDKNVGLDVFDPYHQNAYRGENDNGAKHIYSGWGWGPESYMIKKAIEGNYKIRAYDYHGDSRQGVVLPVFAWIDVYTHFGQKNQKQERMLIRMDEIKNQEMGSVDFKTKSCSKETPIWYIDTCTSCDDTRKLFVSKKQCDLCPGRKMFGDFCIQTCTADKPMQSSVGNCYECNNKKALKLSEEECKKCPNREMKFGYCVLNNYTCPDDKPLREGVVTCQSCDYEKSVIVSPEDCAKCPNREMIGKFCALKQCPADKPLQGKNGMCYRYDCDAVSADILNPDDCAKCPNRKMQGKYCIRKSCSPKNPIEGKNGECYACDAIFSVITEKTECDKCSNRTLFGNQCKLNCSGDRPLQDKTGDCYSCDEDTSVETTKEQCAICPNREFNEGKCVKKTCFSDRDIEGKDGRCYSCDYKGSVHTYKEECAKCSNRYMMKEYCVKSCEKENQIQDTNGRCYDCDTRRSIDVDEKTCKKCPNRVYKDNLCVIPCPKDRPIRDKWGDCHTCDDEDSIQTDAMECKKCSNRTQFGEYCKMACDKYEPMQRVEGDGRCYDCDAEGGLSIPQEECNKCPNREMVNDLCFEKCPDYAPLVDEEGTCYTCDMDEHITRRDSYIQAVTESVGYHIGPGISMQAVKTSKENCLKCPNRIYRDGYCINKAPQGIFMADLKRRQYYACSLERSLDIPKEECDKCSNRVMIGNVCVVKDCPENTPIRLSEGECSSCENDTMLSVSKEQCDRCPNRMMQGPFCTLKECPTDTPMIGNNGRCISCQTDILLSISPKECAKCPNREIKGNYCVLK